jgi:hypothetical protein
MLNNALDCGITEFEFWGMSFAELDRAIQSKERTKKLQLKEKATFDYTLGILIGRAMGGEYPSIAEAYPTLFDKVEPQEKQQERIIELSVLRFKQFANFHNDKYKEVASDK